MYPGKSQKSFLVNTTDWQNNITYEIDKYLNESFNPFDGKSNYKHRTYILVDDIGIKDSIFAIRCPGMTIGHVKFSGTYPDKMIIEEIKIYDDPKVLSMMYNTELISVNFDSYIGKPLVLEEEYFNGED